MTESYLHILFPSKLITLPIIMQVIKNIIITCAQKQLHKI